MQRTAIPNGWLFQITDTNISDAYSEWTAIPSGRLSQKTDTNISETIPSGRPFRVDGFPRKAPTSYVKRDRNDPEKEPGSPKWVSEHFYVLTLKRNRHEKCPREDF